MVVNSHVSNVFWATMPNIVLSFLAILVVWLLPVRSLWSITISMVGLIVTYDLVLLIGKDYFKKLGFLTLSILIIYTLFTQAAARWGAMGITFVIIAYAGWRILRNKPLFMNGIRLVEKQAFGKTFDKEEDDEKEI